MFWIPLNETIQISLKLIQHFWIQLLKLCSFFLSCWTLAPACGVASSNSQVSFLESECRHGRRAGGWEASDVHTCKCVHGQRQHGSRTDMCWTTWTRNEWGRHEASLLVSVCPHANEATSEAETRGHLMQKYETKTIWIILLHVTVWPNIYPHTHKQATQTHTGQNSLFLMEKKKSREKCLPLQFIHFWNKGKTLEMSKMGFVCSEIYLLKF